MAPPLRLRYNQALTGVFYEEVKSNVVARDSVSISSGLCAGYVSWQLRKRQAGQHLWFLD